MYYYFLKVLLLSTIGITVWAGIDWKAYSNPEYWLNYTPIIPFPCSLILCIVSGLSVFMITTELERERENYEWDQSDDT